MQVKIPFLERFREDMLRNAKYETTRTRPYGKTGDYFSAFGATFEIESIRKVKLSEVAEEHYSGEGFGGPEEFEHVWNQIHPRRGYSPEQLVYLHRFRRVA